MKVIELLNRIANDEAIPTSFKFAGQKFEINDNYIEDEDGDSLLASLCTDFSNLNEEIIEEKEIEKLYDLNVTRVDINNLHQVDNFNKRAIIADIKTLQNWTNQIIDKINSRDW